ncbi:type II secretion system minor pseudopilin GspK [Thalassotalea profundi]|uniref:Type II secretion system protein K n=1 Tax=Thalassotalea profundi TaxID=2036687 RepID=A0ABQ3J321_9GAMM|nr:type II secretion system minor pseudopilin GspK [Thalassotalea profundi]GHE99862.1 type II secretion system protein K [Thalassotalea profundi]
MVNIKSRGVALITVMLLVALAAIIATQMLARIQLQTQRTTNIAFNQQAYWYAMGAEAFAKRVLLTAFKDEPNMTHLQQIWAQGENSYPVDFGSITGEITDQQACFNLNALKKEADPSAAPNKKTVAREVFERLLLSLNIEDIGSSTFEAERLADALTDWLDSDSNISNVGGAEDNDYAGKEHPYLSANNYLASVNELRVIEHFTLPIIHAIKPFVCVIPNSDLHQININTLSAERFELLEALLNISPVDAEELLSSRQEEGYENKDDFFNSPQVSKLNIQEELKEQFVVDSEYFKLKASANFNNSYFAMNSLLKVVNNSQITVISRMIGRD